MGWVGMDGSYPLTVTATTAQAVLMKYKQYTYKKNPQISLYLSIVV